MITRYRFYVVQYLYARNQLLLPILDPRVSHLANVPGKNQESRTGAVLVKRMGRTRKGEGRVPWTGPLQWGVRHTGWQGENQQRRRQRRVRIEIRPFHGTIGLSAATAFDDLLFRIVREQHISHAAVHHENHGKSRSVCQPKRIAGTLARTRYHVHHLNSAQLECLIKKTLPTFSMYFIWFFTVINISCTYKWGRMHVIRALPKVNPEKKKLNPDKLWKQSYIIHSKCW